MIRSLLVFVLAGLFSAPLTSGYAATASDFDMAVNRFNKEKHSYWQGQLATIVGPKVKLIVDFSGVPKEAKKANDLDQTGLSTMRNAFYQAMKEPKDKEALAAKLETVKVVNDETLKQSKFDFDKGSKTLTITMTSSEKRWVDHDRLRDYLKFGIE